MKVGFVTNCESMSSNDWETHMPLWPSMRQVFGSGAAILWEHQTSRKLSGGGVSVLHQPVFATRCLTVNSTCLVIGWKTARAVKRPGFLKPSVFRRSVSWRGG